MSFETTEITIIYAYIVFGLTMFEIVVGVVGLLRYLLLVKHRV